MAFVEDMQCKS